MYHAKHAKPRGPRPRGGRTAAAAAALALALCAVIGGAVAWLTASSNEVKNVFASSEVSCRVEETFENGVKTDVKIKNTGDTPAYIRAKVVVCWKDVDGNVSGTVPVEGMDYSITFAVSPWVKHTDGFYYFAKPVDPKGLTDALITKAEKLQKGPDGYDLSVEIIAEAIQNVPDAAVREAWDVTIGDGTVNKYTGGAEA